LYTQGLPSGPCWPPVIPEMDARGDLHPPVWGGESQQGTIAGIAAILGIFFADKFCLLQKSKNMEFRGCDARTGMGLCHSSHEARKKANLEKQT